MTFGIRLRTERIKHKLTTEALADACCVSRSYITLIETDKRLPGKKLIPKIARALHVYNNEIVNWYLEHLREKLL